MFLTWLPEAMMETDVGARSREKDWAEDGSLRGLKMYDGDRMVRKDKILILARCTVKSAQ